MLFLETLSQLSSWQHACLEHSKQKVIQSVAEGNYLLFKEKKEKENNPKTYWNIRF